MTVFADAVRVSAAKAAASAALENLWGGVTPNGKCAAWDALKSSRPASAVPEAGGHAGTSVVRNNKANNNCFLFQNHTVRRTEVRVLHGKRTSHYPAAPLVNADSRPSLDAQPGRENVSPPHRVSTSTTSCGVLTSCSETPLPAAGDETGSCGTFSSSTVRSPSSSVVVSGDRRPLMKRHRRQLSSMNTEQGDQSIGNSGDSGWRGRSEMVVTRRFHVHLNAQLKDCGDLSTLLHLVDRHLLDMDVVNLCTAALRLAKIQAPYSSLPLVLSRLKVRGVEMLSGRWKPWPSQNLSNFSVAMAKLWRHSAAQQPSVDTALLEGLASQAVYSIEQFNPQNLANTAWAFATLGHSSTRLFNAIAGRALEAGMAGWNPQNVANLAWAFATAGQVPPSGLLEAIVDRAVVLMRDFNAQNVANIAWAFVTMRQPSRSLFEAAFSHAIALRRALSHQNLANILWAASHAQEEGVSYGYLFSGLRQQVELAAQRSELSPQELSNIAYAYAASGSRFPEVFAALSTLARARVTALDTQHLSNIAWAFATAGIEDTPLFDALLATASSRLESFTPQGLANLAWACATCRHASPHLFRALETHLLNSHRAYDTFLTQFSDQHLSNLVWAMSLLGHQAPELFEAIGETLRTRTSLSAQHTATVVWAYAMAGPVSAMQLTHLWSKLDKLTDDFDDTGLCSLFQAELALMTYRPKLAPDCLLPASLRLKASRRWQAQATKTCCSAAQQSVAALLQADGVCCHSETLTEDRLFSIDIAVLNSNGPHLAIEVDGPHHFTSNIPFQPLRKTLLRRQLLQARGWTVVSVPFFEWEALTCPAQQLSYLRRKLCLPLGQLVHTAPHTRSATFDISLAVA